MGTQTTYTIRLIDKVTQTANRISKSMGGIKSAAQKASDSISGIGLAAGAIAVGGFFKMGAQLESTQIQFETLMGNAEEGRKLLNDIDKFANATPFSNKGLQDNARLLLAMGVDSNDMVSTLKMLGAVAGTDEAKLSRMALQYGQVISRGTLQGEEFNSFAEAGINIFKELSRVTGVQENVYRDMMRKGQISAKMVQQAFVGATSEGGRYNGMIDKLSQSMEGKWSTVMGTAQYQLATLSLTMKDAFIPMLDAANKIIEKFGACIARNNEQIAIWGKRIIEFIPILLGLIAVIKVINFVMSINPYAVAIVAIAALIYVVIKAWQNFEKFRAVIYGIFEVLKALPALIFHTLFTPFDLLAKKFGAVKDAAISMLQAIDKLSRGDFKGALTNLKSGFNGVFNLKEEKAAIKKAGEIVSSAWAKGAAKAKNEFAIKRLEKLAETTKNKDLGKGGKGGLGTMGLSPELAKLQAEGVVSGNIQTFNINIQTVNGIHTLTTATMVESAESAGKGVLKAIMEAIADIRPQ